MPSDQVTQTEWTTKLTVYFREIKTQDIRNDGGVMEFKSQRSQEDANTEAQLFAAKMLKNGGAVRVDGELQILPAERILGCTSSEMGWKHVAVEPKPEDAPRRPGERIARYRDDSTYRHAVDNFIAQARTLVNHYDLSEIAGMMELAIEQVRRLKSGGHL